MAASIMTPASTDGLVKFSDYPQSALQDERSSAVLNSIFVDPDGRIIRCTVLATIGDKKFEENFCRRAKMRKVRAARSSTGVPIHGSVIDLFTILIPDSKEGQKIAGLRTSPDATLTVKSLPRGAAKSEIAVALEINEVGNVIACEGADPGADQAFVKAACGASAQLGINRESDASGKPVSYVTKKRVAFVTTAQPQR